jgi:hypothetical protein
MSADNKFSLLASLTSLSPTDNSSQPQDDDDNILPPLAVEDDPKSGTTGTTFDEPNENNNNNNTTNNAKSNNSTIGGLLGSSGLLTSFGSTANVGGGLFDQLEEEERKTQEAQERRKLEQEELERQRMEEAQRKEREAAALEAERVMQMEMEKQKQMEDQERAAVAAAAQAAAAQAVHESMTLPNNSNGGSSVMGGLQELSLNEDSAASMGYRPEMNVYSNVMQSGIAANGANYQNGMHHQHQQQQQQQPMEQHPMQYPPQQPPPVPQEQQQPTLQVQQQIHQQQPPQQQQIQQAGYGASSYYYSTSGNVQQIHQQQPTNPIPNQAPMTQSNAAISHNNSNGSSPSSYAQRSQMLQGPPPAVPNNHAPVNNGMSPYSQPPNQQQQQPPQQPYPNMHQSHANGMVQHQQQFNQTNNTQHVVSKPKIKPPPYNPDLFKPVFGPITVTDPILVQSPGVFSGPPHWIYNVVVRDTKNVEGQDQFAAVINNVRRRFRHFVALEDRLRADCLGAILPPRPEKHSTRAIDEASTRQSTQFALQRARELETYLNGLRVHPLAGKSQSLHLFLTHPDHIGAAWPEVSSSIFTRLTEVGQSTATKISEGTSAVMSELNNESQIMAGEDNSELLALASSEGLRIGSVLQAVPKIEGAVAVVGELGERMSVEGLEVQKLVNNVLAHEREYSVPFEILSSGLLRNGRRTSRLAIELGAAAQVFTLQYKLCRYERMAFADRRSALMRRRDARLAADKKAQKLVVHQHSMQSMGHPGMLGGTERDAAMSDEIATDAFNEAEEIGQILQCEVGRIAAIRKKEWSTSLKIIAANMREAHAERAAIWESCRNSFLAEFSAVDGVVPTGEINNGHSPSGHIEVDNSSSEVMH